ncbi:MAG TPA: glycosyltransferase [Arenibaculum sp.]|nr:glycosyltransferase [Arenibaculum sp.]
MICICALTCGRPQGLRALLAGLGDLRTPVGARVMVLIVDNNSDASSRDPVEAARAGMPFELYWVHEPRRGISFARNAALEFAHGHADFVAFIDDDEIPTPDWLCELSRVQRASGAAAVVGPVVPRFSGPVPGWAVEGGFYASRGCGPYGTEPEDGAPVPCGNSGNVLIRCDLLGPDGFRFDEALALTGGEDTLLFAQLAAAGHAVVYARAAIVHETVPPTRLRPSWLVKRWYRTGNTDALIMARGGCSRIGLLARGALRIGAGSVLALVAAATSPRRPARLLGRLYTVARGAGMVAYVLDRRVEEYRTIHGA